MKKEPKEVGVFNSYTKFNKLKIFGIALLIIIVAGSAFYFFAKSLFKYTITFNLNGGSVYNEELTTKSYRFLEKVYEPKNVKKEGYYIDYWSKDENLNSKYNFGARIWRSFSLYVKWEPGVAVRLHFAENEENSDMTTADLKGYFEQYVKAGSDYTLPLVYNTLNEDSSHYGEQLLWYDNSECTGEPFATKTYYDLSESIDIYGKWFDTSESKFRVDSDGTLQKYLGYCNKVILPNTVKKIKDIEPTEFKTGVTEGVNDPNGVYHSVWENVMSGAGESLDDLQIIYLNSELIDIGKCAFRECKSLQRVIFAGDNVESIGEDAFRDCIALQGFEVPSKVEVISSSAFDGAFDAKANVSINLQNVKRIEDMAFINSKIKSITLNKVEFIGKNAFSACNNLGEFIINSENVITSNVDTSFDGTDSDQGIFFGTADSTLKLKIYIPTGKLSQYLSLPYWNRYSSIIQER